MVAVRSNGAAVAEVVAPASAGLAAPNDVEFVAAATPAIMVTSRVVHAPTLSAVPILAVVFGLLSLRALPGGAPLAHTAVGVGGKAPAVLPHTSAVSAASLVEVSALRFAAITGPVANCFSSYARCAEMMSSTSVSAIG